MQCFTRINVAPGTASKDYGGGTGKAIVGLPVLTRWWKDQRRAEPFSGRHADMEMWIWRRPDHEVQIGTSGQLGPTCTSPGWAFVQMPRTSALPTGRRPADAPPQFAVAIYVQ